MRHITQEDIDRFLPERAPETHKGSYGKILLICGSRGFTGAAAMAAMGALRSGAGLVYLGVPESIYAIEAVKLNEAVVFPLPDQDGQLSAEAIPELLRRSEAMDAVAIGCGIGTGEGCRKVVEAILRETKCPVVLDADGINVICQHKMILRDRQAPTILTPHPGEYLRMDYTDMTPIGVQNAAKELGCILLRKGHRTVITDGKTVYENLTGNPGMAVGGSGDVLTGVIAALLGQGLAPLEAAACGAWLHGRAGDLCAKEMGQYGMLPTDYVNVLPRLLK